MEGKEEYRKNFNLVWKNWVQSERAAICLDPLGWVDSGDSKEQQQKKKTHAGRNTPAAGYIQR